MTRATTTTGDLVAALRAAGVAAGTPVGVAWSPDGVGLAHGDALLACPGDGVDAVRRVLEDLRAAAGLVVGPRRHARWCGAGVRVPSSWDLAATHCLLHGGSDRDPALVWAAARGLDPAHRPRTGQLDLLAGGPAPESADDPVDPAEPVRPDGHLRPGWAEHGPPTPEAAARWAAAALVVQAEHERALGRAARHPPLPGHARARPADRLVGVGRRAARGRARRPRAAAGPRHRGAAGRGTGRPATRRRRDRGGGPGRPGRRGPRPGARRRGRRPAQPGQVRALLGRVGIDVPDTRSWRLEPFRGTHPLVAALLDWRKAERIATTYGYGWLDRDVGPDGRLRGSWTGCDGAAGRMTASAGLHNLPAELRPAVAAEPGHAARARRPRPGRAAGARRGVRRRRRWRAATGDDDLYAPVAARLGCRPADREGRRARRDVRPDLRRRRRGAARAGAGLPGGDGLPAGRARVGGRRSRRPTYGGRRVRMWPLPEPVDPAATAAARPVRAQRGGAGRRRRAVQDVGGLGARRPCRRAAEVVLCLHDELLVHVPEQACRRGRRPAARRAGLDRRAVGGRQRRAVRRRRVGGPRWSDAKG